MQKFHRAIFCYYIIGFDRRMHAWLIGMSYSARTPGLLGISDSDRQQVASWLINMFSKKVDFETIIQMLTGDTFFEKNKRDIAKLERDTGKSILTLWDTDPIFAKYPQLRGLARNKEHEAAWAEAKSAAKQKQK